MMQYTIEKLITALEELEYQEICCPIVGMSKIKTSQIQSKTFETMGCTEEFKSSYFNVVTNGNIIDFKVSDIENKNTVSFNLKTFKKYLSNFDKTYLVEINGSPLVTIEWRSPTSYEPKYMVIMYGKNVVPNWLGGKDNPTELEYD